MPSASAMPATNSAAIAPSRTVTPSSSAPAKPTAPIVRLYLIAYNLVSAAGWAAVWLLIVHHLATASSPISTLYSRIQLPLKIVQTLAAVELLHAALGLVRSGLITTALQLSSRLFVVWGVLHLLPPSRSQLGLLLCTLSWATVEVPRYLYYAVNLVAPQSVPSTLTWLRYSLFMLLYPTGITGEILSMIAALPWLSRHDAQFSISMPNRLNFSFSYLWLMYAVLALYVPGSPFLFMNMWRQRSKVMARADEQAAAGTAGVSKKDL
jgi:very-long-chain (3R)-3-hydroxyacyl-CoA dehydratase